MQTNFSLAQLADPQTANSEKILRTCVHCGICTSTCPTYVLLGDELDSPRGRIYLMKDMFENGRKATKDVVQHLDRCLSCLSCMSTCPSSVDYMHLIDHGRSHIEATYKRPIMDRMTRWVLSVLIPYHRRFGWAMRMGQLMRPLKPLMPTPQLRAMLDLAPQRFPKPEPLDRPGVYQAAETTSYRVAMLPGCAQRALAPSINAATVRLLQRHDCQVIYPEVGCCGSLVHHMGKDAHGQAKGVIDAIWTLMQEPNGLDAFVINASGCGTTVKDYAHMFAEDPAYADKAKAISALAKDLTEWLDEIGLKPAAIDTNQTKVTYHSACSLQHGQRVKLQPVALLKTLGFKVKQPRNGHLCCGSAGTYNIMQPEIAGQLLERKVETLAETKPDIIAAGNIGCLTQIARGIDTPIVHTAELIDWATGGPKPESLA